MYVLTCLTFLWFLLQVARLSPTPHLPPTTPPHNSPDYRWKQVRSSPATPTFSIGFWPGATGGFGQERTIFCQSQNSLRVFLLYEPIGIQQHLNPHHVSDDNSSTKNTSTLNFWSIFNWYNFECQISYILFCFIEHFLGLRICYFFNRSLCYMTTKM